MRKIIRLWFVFILLGEQFLFANFPSGGYELFCHDWIAVPGVANQVLAQTNTLLSYILPLPPVIGQDHYAVLSWTPPAAPVAVPGGAIALPPLLLSAQATLALKRFLVGITNYRHNLDNFIHPQAIIHTALGLPIPAGIPAGYVPRALASGGYNTTAARFLHDIHTGFGLPFMIGNTVAIVLSLDRRVSKDIKEIHWNSSSSLHAQPGIVAAMAAAFPGLIPPMPPAGAPLPAILDYQSIKHLINAFFPPAIPPDSATIVTFQRTSVN